MSFIKSYIQEWREGNRRPEDFTIFQNAYSAIENYLNRLPNDPIDAKLTSCALTTLTQIKKSGFCAISSLEGFGFETKIIHQLFHDIDVLIF